MKIDTNYDIRVSKSIQEVESIRQTWERMQWHPNADIDFYLNIIDSRPEVLRPHVILLSSDELPRAMLIGRIEETMFEFRFGYKTLYKSKVRMLRIVYGGILGEQNDAYAEGLVSALLNALHDKEADLVYLDLLKVGSEMHRVAKARPTFFSRDHVFLPNMHWEMTMPDTIDKLFQDIKPKHRRYLRRTLRLLEKENGKVEFKCLNEKSHVHQLCNDAEEIAGKTYQRGLSVGFISNLENRRRMDLSADRGWLHAYVLYVKNKPCAFWIGTLYGETLFLEFTGYDQSYRKYEPGTLVLMQMLEDLCRDSGKIKNVDFGFGDAMYKERFATHNWEETSVYIFGPTLKGIKLNCLRTLNGATLRVAERVIRQLNLREKLKKKWRDRLSPKRGE